MPYLIIVLYKILTRTLINVTYSLIFSKYIFHDFMYTYILQVDMLSLHDEGHRVRLEDIYVPIKTVTYKKTAGREEKKTLNYYTEMFTEQVF